MQPAAQPQMTIDAPPPVVTAVAPPQYSYAVPQPPPTTVVAAPVYVEAPPPQPPVVSVEVREPITTAVMEAPQPQPVPTTAIQYAAPQPFEMQTLPASVVTAAPVYVSAQAAPPMQQSVV